MLDDGLLTFDYLRSLGNLDTDTSGMLGRRDGLLSCGYAVDTFRMFRLAGVDELELRAIGDFPVY